MFSFHNTKIYNIRRYVIPHVLRHMCNLHIKEICQKRSKGIKNWNITYSVILSVLSNKTNLIWGFSSLLRGCSYESGQKDNLIILYALPTVKLSQFCFEISFWVSVVAVIRTLLSKLARLTGLARFPGTSKEMWRKTNITRHWLRYTYVSRYVHLLKLFFEAHTLYIKNDSQIQIVLPL